MHLAKRCSHTGTALVFCTYAHLERCEELSFLLFLSLSFQFIILIPQMLPPNSSSTQATDHHQVSLVLTLPSNIVPTLRTTSCFYFLRINLTPPLLREELDLIEDRPIQIRRYLRHLPSLPLWSISSLSHISLYPTINPVTIAHLTKVKTIASSPHLSLAPAPAPARLQDQYRHKDCEIH